MQAAQTNGCFILDIPELESSGILAIQSPTNSFLKMLSSFYVKGMILFSESIDKYPY